MKVVCFSFIQGYPVLSFRKKSEGSSARILLSVRQTTSATRTVQYSHAGAATVYNTILISYNGGGFANWMSEWSEQYPPPLRQSEKFLDFVCVWDNDSD